MLDVLITSKTRLKLLLKFFLNPSTSTYLRELEAEFGESSNGIRLELNRLEKAGMLTAKVQGNKKLFKVNNEHPLFADVKNIVHKYVGLDIVIAQVTKRLGSLEAVYLTGDLAQGKQTSIIDIILIGEVNKQYLVKLLDKAEGLLNKSLRYTIFATEPEATLTDQVLLLWSRSGKHTIETP